jgi:hypothetical protein
VIAEVLPAASLPLDPVTTGDTVFMICASLCQRTPVAQNNDENAEDDARRGLQ